LLKEFVRKLLAKEFMPPKYSYIENITKYHQNGELVICINIKGERTFQGRALDEENKAQLDSDGRH
jgi:hypothetical protein